MKGLQRHLKHGRLLDGLQSSQDAAEGGSAVGVRAPALWGTRVHNDSVITLLTLSFWFVIFLFYFEVFTSCLCLFPPFFLCTPVFYLLIIPMYLCLTLCQFITFHSVFILRLLCLFPGPLVFPVFLNFVPCGLMVCPSFWYYYIYCFGFSFDPLLLTALGFYNLSSWIKAHFCLFVSKLWQKLHMYMNCHNAPLFDFAWFCVSATKKSFFFWNSWHMYSHVLIYKTVFCH